MAPVAPPYLESRVNTNELLDVLLKDLLPVGQGKTMPELMEETRARGRPIGRDTLRKWIRQQVAAGKLEVVRVPVVDVTTRATSTWGYRFKNGKKVK